MITLKIKKNEAEQRLDKYLKKRLRNASPSFLYKMLRKKNIVLNGKKALGQEIVSFGDTVTLFFSEETFQKMEGASREESWKKDTRYRPPEVLYETKDLVFFNKPAGLLSQKAKESDFSANEQLLRYLYEKGELTEEELLSFHPSIVNRLDRNTSGILMGGKTLKGLKDASQLLRDRELKKYYHAIVSGQLKEGRILEGWLTKDHKRNQVRILTVETANASYIRSEVSPVEMLSDATLVSIRLHTGKTHQIRAQLASIGFPILGDPKYGRPGEKRNSLFSDVSRQMLHAREIVLPDGTVVTAPYPSDFERTLDAARHLR